MKRIKNLLLIAIFGLVAVGGWKVGSCELANVELQQDLLDLSSDIGIHAGYTSPRTDEEFRKAVIHDAFDHDIQLDPSQVVVRRTGTGALAKMYLAADYTETVTLPYYSFTLHFHPESDKKGF